jgi:hypothetical protein
VVIHFSAFNDEIGLKTVTPDYTFINEGTNLSFTGIAIDKADVVSSYTVSGINIDKTAPEITIHGIEDGAKYKEGEVPDVSYDASDALSGVDNDWDNLSLVDKATDGSGGGVYLYTVTAIDQAGNRAVKMYHYTVGYDFTGPKIIGNTTVPANDNGWFNQDVTIHFEVNDAESGVKTYPSDVILTQEGVGLSASATAVDNAGNSTEVTVGDINIDKTTPVVEISGITDGASYFIGNTIPQINYTATDSLSEIDQVVADYVSENRNIGKIVYAVAATDRAGNKTTKSISYSVVYDFTWKSPALKRELTKVGKALPLEFVIRDGAGKIATTTHTSLVVKNMTNGQTGDALINLTDVFELKNRRYRYELSTKELPKGDYQIVVSTDDEVPQILDITIKK